MSSLEKSSIDTLIPPLAVTTIVDTGEYPGRKSKEGNLLAFSAVLRQVVSGLLGLIGQNLLIKSQKADGRELHKSHGFRATRIVYIVQLIHYLCVRNYKL